MNNAKPIIFLIGLFALSMFSGHAQGFEILHAWIEGAPAQSEDRLANTEAHLVLTLAVKGLALQPGNVEFVLQLRRLYGEASTCRNVQDQGGGPIC